MEKSQLLEKDKDIQEFKYTKEEKEYLKNLQKRLSEAKTARDKPHNEFDGMTLVEYYNKNDEWANTRIQPKKNKNEISFRSGTLRTKMMSLLSSIVGLNLSPDITAYTKEEIRVNELSNAMEDIIEKTNELEEDEEKRLLRQYELFKQGTIFIQEVWDEPMIIEKDVENDFVGKFRGVKWKTTTKKDLAKPVKTIIPIISVYLGDITQYFITNQPFIFTNQKITYEKAKQIYGKWDMFKYVSKDFKSFDGTNGIENNHWQLTQTKKGYVEILKYQDKPNNEFQVIINGVPMLPIGYPLTKINGYREYNISQQNLEPIREDFAYGKSFVFNNKNNVGLLDEMIKLALLKTQKSYMPPYINIGNKVISSAILMPGKITMGIDSGVLQPVSDKESQGVTNSEFAMIQELKQNIDQNTTSQTFGGQREQGQVTATQIIEIQRQAKIMMGIVILANSLMEKKINILRLMNILANWFEPTETIVNQSRNEIKNRYRIVSMDKNIEGEGQGTRMTIPTQQMPTGEQLVKVEDEMQTKTGKPVRIIAINPDELKLVKYMWLINVFPKEKKSSELSKLMFKEEIATAMNLGLRLNIDYVEQRFGEVYEENVNKMFQQKEQNGGMPEQPQVGGGMPTQGTQQPQGGAKPQLAPKIPIKE